MNNASFSSQKAFNALSSLSRGEAWLLSVKIAAHRVELIGDFSHTDTELNGEKMLVFCGVVNLRLSYNQSVFGAGEEDISTIDVIKVENDGSSQYRTSHISFEFSYGALQFDFEDVEIYDRTDASISPLNDAI